MNTIELINILNCVIKGDSCPSVGVYPRDKIVTNYSSYPAAVICNTDNAEEPGEHWVAFYFISSTSYEFFDSFGFHPFHYGFHLPEPIEYNMNQFQSVNSNVCGEFCLYFLFHKSKGSSFNNISNKFSGSTRWNDKFVKHQVHNLTNSLCTADFHSSIHCKYQCCISFNSLKKRM